MNRRSNLQVIIAVVVALGGIISYFSTRNTNTVTGEVQHVKLTADQEIAAGQNAEPQMVEQYGGELAGAQADYVHQVGAKVVAGSDAGRTPYQFQFHLLSDPRTVNAFALPGGQVFITEGLLRLLHNEAELAGVLGHEVGHVVARHGAEQMAKQGLTESMVGAASVYAYDPNRPGRSVATAAAAQAIGSMVNMKYGRDDENEADGLGVKFLKESGYDPQGMAEVMQVLAKVAQGNRTPEFFSTHPNPENRLQRIQQEIAQVGGPGGERGEAQFAAVMRGAAASPRGVGGSGNAPRNRTQSAPSSSPDWDSSLGEPGSAPASEPVRDANP